MSSLVEIVEVWTPDDAGHVLEFAGGLYERAPEFGAISRGQCFGRGEGLPGRVWEAARPMLMHELTGPSFVRSAAAARAGLSAALGMPLWDEDRVVAVVVFFLVRKPAQAGGIEIWHNDPRITGDMTLLDADYAGEQSQSLGAASRETYLPRGSGLPGLAWQSGQTVFMPQLAQEPRFVRSDAAQAAGLCMGLAIPCASVSVKAYVVAMLGAASHPIAKRLESWTWPENGSVLLLRWADEAQAEAAGVDAQVSDEAKQVIQAARDGRLPAFGRCPRPAYGDLAMVAIPLFQEGVVSEVLALYL